MDQKEEVRQKQLASQRPTQWYPETPIHTVSRGAPVPTHDRLFTPRNLTHLAHLHAAIDTIESVPYKEALQYVFTAALYSCSRMQMYSEKDPASSRGWTALRYYIPPICKETNVLHAFSRRFESFVSCKVALNEVIPTVRVTDDTQAFNCGAAELLVQQMDWRECVECFGQSASHVFLDPPYNQDVDYFGFSEFWGVWLGAEFPFQAEWHARERKGAQTVELLKVVADSTSPGCRIVLALDPKDPTGWEVETGIKASGYKISKTGFFLYDQTNKPGRTNDLLRRRDRYYVLERGSSKGISRRVSKQVSTLESSNEQVYPYIRVAASLPSSRNMNAAKLKTNVLNGLVPPHLRSVSDNLDTGEIDRARSDEGQNRATYHAFCIALLSALLKNDGWTLRQTRKGEVDESVFGLSHAHSHSSPKASATAVLSSRDKQRSILVFFLDEGHPLPSAAATAIKDQDNDRFERIALLITPNRFEMEKLRAVGRAALWPRGFFLCIEELRERCAEMNPSGYLRISSPPSVSAATKALRRRTRQGIGMFPAKVLGNVRVGDGESPYRKLQFEAHGLTGIVPGQFIMMDTWPRAALNGTCAVPWQEFKTAFQEAPRTYLKRPFGIHRTFYPGFAADYLKRLQLPPSLATVIHTVLPDRFEIFYKVLPNGKGTNEMKQLRKGMTVQMQGPLGHRFDIRRMVNDGVKEVHVIGGGVGMAPLIFLVQALRYFSVPVKAFIGIESISRLRYRQQTGPDLGQSDQIDESYAAGGEDADIYVDDLKDAGVAIKDIFVSYDRTSGMRDIVPPDNHVKGFVSDLYAGYLSKHRTSSGIVAFACGPMPMMEKIYRLTKGVGMDLHVLMEKRMACGIGVCLSCVCRTKTGYSGYSRVCVDGPIFNGRDIDWNAT